MPQVAAAVEALDPGHVAEAVRGERRIGINVDGAEHPLEPDDVTLVMEPLEGYEVEAEAGRAVALSLELDDELLREGLAREIVHAIQGARKERRARGLRPNRARARRRRRRCSTAARAHEEYVAGETLATSVAYDGAEAATAASIEGASCGSSLAVDGDAELLTFMLVVDRADQLVGPGLLELMLKLTPVFLSISESKSAPGPSLDDVVLAGRPT